MHPGGLSLRGANCRQRRGDAEQRWEAGRVGVGAGHAAHTETLPTWLSPTSRPHGAVQEAAGRTFSRPAGLQVTHRPGRHVTRGVWRAALWAGRGRDLTGAPPRPGPVNWRPRGGRPLRGAAVGGGGDLAGTVMATVREKAAALNLSALHSPAQRPPGRC